MISTFFTFGMRLPFRSWQAPKWSTGRWQAGCFWHDLIMGPSYSANPHAVLPWQVLPGETCLRAVGVQGLPDLGVIFPRRVTAPALEVGVMEQRDPAGNNTRHVRAKLRESMIVFMTAVYEEHVNFEGKQCLHCLIGIGTMHKPPGGIPDERLHLRVIRHPVDVHAGNGSVYCHGSCEECDGGVPSAST